MPTRGATYLDANASSPLKREAREALAEVLGLNGALPLANPSSSHSLGRRSKKLLSEAREAIAASLAADPEQLILVGSGSEANQMVIRSLLLGAQEAHGAGASPVWIASAGDHDSVLQLRDWWLRRGGRFLTLPLLPDGRPDVERLWELIGPETALVSLCWINNETGVVSDLSRARSTLSAFPWVKLHLDAVQAWGKIPLRVEETGASALTVSGHKIGGPAGTGAIWVNRGVRLLHPLVHGKQEKGRRGGTENLLGWVGAGAAAKTLDPGAYIACVEPLRRLLETEVLARIPGVAVNGSAAPRVANTSNFSFEGVEGEGLVMALDLEGYCVSVGSACSSGVQEPSHVLLAMGYTAPQALGSVRISLWEGVSREDVLGFVDALVRVVSRIRGLSSARVAGKSV